MNGELPLLVVLAFGVFVGVGYAEFAIVHRRIRDAWQRGYDAGQDVGYRDGLVNGRHEGRESLVGKWIVLKTETEQVEGEIADILEGDVADRARVAGEIIRQTRGPRV